VSEIEIGGDKREQTVVIFSKIEFFFEFEIILSLYGFLNALEL